MGKEIYNHSTMLDLPLFTLLLFVAVFIGVVFYVWRRGANHPDHAHLASLPLADDTPDLYSPTPNATDRGGDHGRR